jgi:hypothetical protein
MLSGRRGSRTPPDVKSGSSQDVEPLCVPNTGRLPKGKPVSLFEQADRRPNYNRSRFIGAERGRGVDFGYGG